MNKEEILEKFRMEAEILSQFNTIERLDARKAEPIVGRGNRHEFDIFQVGKVIGGISTSAWKNRTGTNNTAGQDRIAAELLWLTLWPGPERRVMILTSREMTDRLLKRWQGCSFPQPIEILHFDLSNKIFQRQGVLSK